MCIVARIGKRARGESVGLLRINDEITINTAKIVSIADHGDTVTILFDCAEARKVNFRGEEADVLRFWIANNSQWAKP